MDKTTGLLAMKMKYYNIGNSLLYLLNLFSLIISIVASILFIRRGLWGFSFLAILTAVLNFGCLGSLMSWAFQGGGIDDEDDIPYSISNIPKVILILTISISGFMLFGYSFKG